MTQLREVVRQLQLTRLGVSNHDRNDNFKDFLYIFLYPDGNRGYLGFSPVIPPQKFSVIHGNLKIFSVDLSHLVCWCIGVRPQSQLFSGLGLPV